MTRLELFTTIFYNGAWKDHKKHPLGKWDRVERMEWAKHKARSFILATPQLDELYVAQ